MEDYSRDLEKELSKYSVPNPFKQSRSWQLLFISDDGKTISVKKYKGLVISIIVALITAILFSICLTVLYYKSNVEKKSLRLAIEKADKELRKATEEKELLNAKLFFEKKENHLITDTGIKIDEKKTKPKKVDKKVEPVINKVTVGVETFSMTQDSGSKYTKIKFHIRNTSKVKRISGYVFVVLKPESDKQRDWMTLPPVLLKDGEPSVYKRGRFFSINHFKSMNFKFKNNFDDEYKTAVVYVYSKAADSPGESLKVVETSYPVTIKAIEEKKAVENKKNTVKTTDNLATPVMGKIKAGAKDLKEGVDKTEADKTSTPIVSNNEEKKPQKTEVVEGETDNAH